MSKQQQTALDAIVRQGPLGLDADVPTLRAVFNDVMGRVPMADDVDQEPTTIGGVGGVGVLAASDSSRPAEPVDTAGR